MAHHCCCCCCHQHHEAHEARRSPDRTREEPSTESEIAELTAAVERLHERLDELEANGQRDD